MTDEDIRRLLEEFHALTRVATILDTAATSSPEWRFVRRAIADRAAQVQYALAVEDAAVVAALELDVRRAAAPAWPVDVVRGVH